MKKLCAVLLAIFSIVMCFAQVETYRLMPEDIVRIQIYREGQVNAIVPIGKDGNISAPFVGIVRAQGLTTSELEAALKTVYVQKLRLRDPKISVTIEKYRVMRASVTGAVNRPGVYEMRPTDSVMALVANGGGLLLDGRANTRRATLKRGGTNELIPIDLYSMLVLGDLSQDYKLEDGDILNVPEGSKPFVYVLGAVPQPRAYPFREQMTLVDALSLSGGEIQYRTMLSKTVVTREEPGKPGVYKRITCDLVKFFKKGDASQNMILEPGDVVYFQDTKTPDGGRIGAVTTGLANALFILDRFGFKIFGGR